MLHQDIEERSLALVRAIVARIDADPSRHGVALARKVCARWRLREDSRDLRLWADILDRPWAEIRARLLDPSEEGRRLRQSNPFCGILSPRERWAIYREFSDHAAA